MRIEDMAKCTRVKAPKHTLTYNNMTFETRPLDEVIEWTCENNIWDWDLVAEDDGDHGPLYVYYFVNPTDATLFSLRWS